MEKNNSNKNLRLIRTYLPAAGLLLVTIIVMVYFKSVQGSGYDIFDQGGSILERFYTKNLKPMFASRNQLSNEDMVNFAFNNNLPISEDKVLFISENPERGREIGVKDAILNKNTNNYEKFVNQYCKDEKSRSRVDSILDYYREDLTASVLESENEAIAIDENIYKLNRALQTELLECATKSPVMAANAKSAKVFNINMKNVVDYKNYRFNDDEKKLVFLTPDTVFSKEYKFDKNKIVSIMGSENREIEDYGDLIIPVAKEVPELKSAPKLKEYKVGEKTISAFFEPDENYAINLRDSLKKMQIALKDLFKGSEAGSVAFKINSDTESVNFEFNFHELGDLIFKSLEAVGDQKAKNWEEFGLKMDSAAKIYEQTIMDSIIKMTIKKNKAEKRKKIRRKNR